MNRLKIIGIVSILLLSLVSCEDKTDNKLIFPPVIESVRTVACIGNSITFGARQFLTDRETECYPALLGGMLGDKFEVKNFGCSGTCVLKNGNSPYWKVKEFSNAKAALPNIVIIKFGTNDSRSLNWSHCGVEFEADLTEMILAFRALSTRPRVFLCTPAIAYANTIGASNTVIENEIIPIINKVAKKNNLTVIDLHTALKGYQALFPDGIHCVVEGNRIIASTIYGVLSDIYIIKK